MNLIERQMLKWQILALIIEMKGLAAKPTDENFTLEQKKAVINEKRAKIESLISTINPRP